MHMKPPLENRDVLIQASSLKKNIEIKSYFYLKIQIVVLHQLVIFFNLNFIKFYKLLIQKQVFKKLITNVIISLIKWMFVKEVRIS